MQKILPAITVVLIVAVFGVWWQFGPPREETIVTNFQECVAAGNPVLESYPRQCHHGDQRFVEDIEIGNIPTSADNAPPGSIHNLPVADAVAAVRTLAAQELGISEGVVIVMSAYEREWSSSCLGFAAEGEQCALVVTPGYEVTVQAQGKERLYHTNHDGSSIRRVE